MGCLNYDTMLGVAEKFNTSGGITSLAHLLVIVTANVSNFSANLRQVVVRPV